MAKETESALIVQRDTSKAAAVDIRDVIVLRQSLVDESVVRRQQLGDATVFPDLALDEHLGLLTQRAPEILLELGKQDGVRRQVFELSQPEPLASEVLCQGD